MSDQEFDLRLKTPFTCLLAGPSQSGKTSWVFNVLRDRQELMTEPTDNIIFFYNQWQRSFTIFQAENIVTQWVNQLPTTSMLMELTEAYKDTTGSIVVIDDFMQKVDQDIVDLFTVLCHSYHISVFLMSQNVFPQNKLFRDISLNSTYIVLFKNPRDSSQIRHFANQFSPNDIRWLVEAFRECTKKPYSYLMFDHHQRSDDDVRVLSNFLRPEWPMRVWMRTKRPT